MRLDEKAVDLIAAEEEVLLDMDDIDKELLPDEESFFVLLRNLDADPAKVKLDFSRLAFSTKQAWLEAYAKTSLLVDVEELAIAWAEVVHATLSQHVDDVKSSYFAKDELCKFIFNDIKLCEAVAQLLHDAMHWAAAYSAKTDYTQDGFCQTQLSPSLLFACKHIASFDFKLLSAFKTCKAWPSIFKQENFAPALQMMLSSKACILLYGKSTPQWEHFQKLFNQTFAS